jgi:hypothetical protein
VDAPQSDVEVRPVVDALRRIDSRLDVIWNPRAFIETPGEYDATGKLVAPVYAGRWQVILHDRSAKTAEWRDYTLVCTVTAPAADAPRGVHALTHEGPYAPVGPWLVEHIEAIDRANAANLEKIKAAIDADWERQLARRAAAHEDATREALGRQYDDGTREAGVAQFHPVGIDLRSPVTTR